MNGDNTNNELGPIAPPPKENLTNIRTMNSDRQSTRQGGIESYKHPRPEFIQPRIVEEKIPEPIETEEKPFEISSIPEPISNTEAPKAIPGWAQEKLEEEATTEPVGRKAITFTIIILAIIIGFVLIGYFVASKLIFKR